MATGGVPVAEARQYLAAGARMVGFGAAAVAPHRVDQLAELMRQLTGATEPSAR